jgi:NTP pyrophosphatase (non-canonical NTP hydrolase)
VNDSSNSVNILLTDYEDVVASTDRFNKNEIKPILLGLFGEVGSVMSTSKKLQREKEAFAGYKHDVEEELGDALWYLTAICRRFNISLTELFADVLKSEHFTANIAANNDPHNPLAQVISSANIEVLDLVLLHLGEQTAKILNIEATPDQARPLLQKFVRLYIDTVQASKVSFSRVLSVNISKTQGRFIEPDFSNLPNFDANFPEEEQLPHHFEVEITQRKNGSSYLRWNNVFIGDPLKDNISDSDGYRFHDVFHLANAAILHWSPTFRALIKHKRKSDTTFDEAQDSGRAIVIDEGLSAYIFSYAKNLNFFEGQESVSFDLLKSVKNFVRGYEVEKCPLHLWENAIIEGYKVFRSVRDNNGGIVIGDRKKRTIEYAPSTGE